jgi:exodeoxyribonuclease-5
LAQAVLGTVAMSEFTPSPMQAKAIDQIIHWYLHESKEKQLFRVFGFAGAGKTTILKAAMDRLGGVVMPRIGRNERVVNVDFQRKEVVDEDARRGQPPNVLFATFTGKAALVMSRKGTPASTIHSLIYAVTEPTKETIEKAKLKLAELHANPPTDATQAMLWRAMVRDRELEIKNMHRPTFVLNTESILRDADLLVIDEVSMISEEMACDLLSFKKPILVLGDPGQLPPIKGEGYFTQAEPDVFLSEIHRQAEDSAIIRLATMAREGKYIPIGRHSDTVWKVDRNSLNPQSLLRADQVICGFNATRIMLNNELKRAAGFPEPLPVGGEKIICLKNQHDSGLINGQFLELSQVEPASDKSFRAHIKTEDGQDIGQSTIYRGHFDDHVNLDKDRGERDYFIKKGRVECVWGYAITGHKSQGSGWNNVIVFDDGFGRKEDRKKWLYTCITRAISGLVIME